MIMVRTANYEDYEKFKKFHVKEIADQLHAELAAEKIKEYANKLDSYWFLDLDVGIQRVRIEHKLHQIEKDLSDCNCPEIIKHVAETSTFGTSLIVSIMQSNQIPDELKMKMSIYSATIQQKIETELPIKFAQNCICHHSK